MSTVTEVRWHGAGELRGLIVPVESVSLHEANPRRGDLAKIAADLDHFGQLKPIVLNAESTIIAGNHVYRAAVEVLGWTHVSAVMADHLSTEDATLFLLADNAASEAGGYDFDMAAAYQRHLAERAESEEDPEVADAFRQAAESLSKLAAKATAPPAFQVIDPDGMAIDWRCPDASCGYEWSGGAAA